MNQCPYCKIDFHINSWAKPRSRKTVCRNCRFYNEATTMQERERREWELFKVHGSLPLKWWELPEYTTATPSSTLVSAGQSSVPG